MLESQVVSPQAAATELLKRRNARRNLLDFTLYTFPDYRPSWHHILLCNYLDRFVSGEIKRLIVTTPPRHGKSELVSRRLPAYIFGRNPHARVMAASYAASLSQRFNRDVQRIIESDAYQRLFPETRLFSSNVRTVARGTWLRNSEVFEIVGHRGMYRNAGVGGGLTGFGFDRGIIDDPLKDRAEANSPTIREARWDWYTSVFYTRQQKNAGVLITVTRWHLNDIVGRLLEKMKKEDGEDWVVVTLPALMEDTATKHPQDPRALGDALWPDEFPLEHLETVRAQSEFDFAALYQQHPIPVGAGLFETENIEVIDYVPDCDRVVRFYDLAVTVKRHSDFTAGVKLGITKDESPVILDMYRVQKTMPDVEKGIAQNANMDGREVPIRLEGEKAGIVQLDYLLRRPDLGGYVIDKKAPVGDKFTRAQPFASRVNAGKVLMVRADWNRALLDELALFPLGAHDDQVDVLSGAYEMLVTDVTIVRSARYA